eukprot:3373846-Rhodomonas_salina.1
MMLTKSVVHPNLEGSLQGLTRRLFDRYLQNLERQVNGNLLRMSVKATRQVNGHHLSGSGQRP